MTIWVNFTNEKFDKKISIVKKIKLKTSTEKRSAQD